MIAILRLENRNFYQLVRKSIDFLRHSREEVLQNFLNDVPQTFLFWYTADAITL